MSLDSSIFSLANEQLWKNGLFNNTTYEEGCLKLKSETVYRSTASWDYGFLMEESQRPYMQVDSIGLIYLLVGALVYVYDWVAQKYDVVYEHDGTTDLQELKPFVVKDKLVIMEGKDTLSISVIALHGGAVIIDKAKIPVAHPAGYFVADDFSCYILNQEGELYQYDLKSQGLNQIATLEKESPFENGVLKVGEKHVYWLQERALYVWDRSLGTERIISCVEAYSVRSDSVVFVTLKEGYTSVVLDDEEVIKRKSSVSEIDMDTKGRLYLKCENHTSMDVYQLQRLTKRADQGKPYTGSYYLPLIDAGAFESQWVRFKLQFERTHSSQINVAYYAFDEAYIHYQGKQMLWSEWYRDASIPLDQKIPIIDKKLKDHLKNPEDALFQQTYGRYLIVRLELWGTEEISPTVKGLRIYFNEPSFIYYLPEIYQTGESKDFLERFLKIMETIYLDIEEKIDLLSNFTDIDRADDAFLRWMTHWVDFEVDETWETEQVRTLLKYIPMLYQKRGTKVALKKLLQIYLGYEPLIIENYEMEKLELETSVRKLLEDSYGDSPYGFSVLAGGPVKLTDQQKTSIKRMIEKEIPAHTHYKFIELDPWISLDKQSYLSVNSYLSEQSYMKLDNQSIIPFHSKLKDDNAL